RTRRDHRRAAPPSGFQFCKHFLRDPMRLDRGREATIDSHLPEDRAEFLRSAAVAQRAAEVQFELVHAAEAGNHAHVEDAAVARREIVVAPDRAPGELVEQVLKLAVEVGGVFDGAVDILVAEHPAAHRHALVVESLVHSRIPPCPAGMVTERDRARPWRRRSCAWLSGGHGAGCRQGRQTARNQLLRNPKTRTSPARRAARKGRFCHHYPLNGHARSRMDGSKGMPVAEPRWTTVTKRSWPGSPAATSRHSACLPGGICLPWLVSPAAFSATPPRPKMSPRKRCSASGPMPLAGSLWRRSAPGSRASWSISASTASDAPNGSTSKRRVKSSTPRPAPASKPKAANASAFWLPRSISCRTVSARPSSSLTPRV